MPGFFLFFLNRYAIVSLSDCLNIPFLRMVILSFILCSRTESVFIKQITFLYRIGSISF
ncbi:hypothetical protein BOVAC2_917 [Bacteroides ovatus]|nr:hypothetical protein BOVAC2_917 [Bacteroides ovatus]